METQTAQLERLRLQVALDVWTAYQNLTTATQSLRTTADLLNSAEQSERVALGRYFVQKQTLIDLSRIPSISAHPFPKEAVQKSAAAVADALRAAGVLWAYALSSA